MGDIDLIRKPDGSKKHPALTCKDLFYNYPTLASGKQIIFSKCMFHTPVTFNPVYSVKG